MDQSLYVVAPMIRLQVQEAAPPPTTPPEHALAGVLKSIVELQREQLTILRQQQANADHNARWRNFLNKWQEEFPRIGRDCRAALPQIERAYLLLIQEVTERIRESEETLESEFAVSEFLDRYALKLSQLGTLMSQLAPIVEATPPEPAA